MGDPSNASQVTVTGTWRLRLADGTTVAATGYVTFTPTTRLTDGGSSEILPVSPVRAVLDATGHISTTLLATDDPDLAPSGWGYQVTEYVGGTTDSYFAVFPTAIPTVDLSTVAPATVTPLIGYVPLSAVGAPTGVASLDSGGQVPLSQLGNAPSGGGTPSGTVSSSAVGDAAAAGASANYSRGDHVHGREAYGLPAASAVGDTQSGGVATTDARSDHRHARESFGGAPGTTEGIGQSGAAGAATTPSRSDHVHPMAAAGAPVASAIGDTQSTGVATTFAASDHRHAREALGGVPTSSAVGDAVAAGTGTTNARVDHVHGRESFGGAPGTTLGIGSASAAGVATTPSRSDHSHATQGAGTPGSSAEGDAAAAGSAATFARSDHVHARESFGGAPATTEGIGQAAAAGAATTPSRSDHVHPMAAAGAPGASAVGDTQSTGVATTFAASDHRHAREGFGGTPAQNVAGAGTAGAATTDTRSDHAHPSAAVTCTDLGLSAWSMDPGVFNGSTPTTAVAGTVQVIEIWAPANATVTNIVMQVQTAGVSLTSGQCFAALYDASKNLLQTTADQSGTWNSGGVKNMPITSQAVTAGKLYVAWFYNGTTPPRFLGNTSGTSVINGQLSAANSRFATADTGRTTTMPGSLGAFTASGQSVFAAIF